MYVFFFFKQKTAYEVRISDWSSDVCSSDLRHGRQRGKIVGHRANVAVAQFGGDLLHHRQRRIGSRAALPRIELARDIGGMLRGDRREARRDTEARRAVARKTRRNALVPCAFQRELLAASQTAPQHRSDERRVGQEGSSTCHTTWSA